MAYRTYQFIIGTDIRSNANIAVAQAGANLHRIHDRLDRRKFTADVMDVVVHGDDGTQEIGVAFDVMYTCSDEDYLDTIEDRLDRSTFTEYVDEVYYEKVA